MDKLINAIKSFFVEITRDKSETMEQYIASHNPTSVEQVEFLERQYDAMLLRRRMM